MAKPNWSFRVEAKAQGDIEIAVYDIIGKSFFGDGISAGDVLAALRANPNAKRISLRVNSIGGIVDDARAMINLLNERAAAGVTIEAHVDGIAASAASYLLTAASRVVMPANAFLMFHQARAGVMGNAKQMTIAAEVLQKTNEHLAAGYAAASARRGKGKTAGDFLAAFEKGDTYLTAAEAIEWGLADETAEPLQAAACLVDLTELGDVPADLRRAPYASTDLPAPVPVAQHQPAAAAPVVVKPAAGGETIKAKMNEETLKAQHPELYAAIVAAAVAGERKRVCAHLKLAKSTGAVDVAHAAIASGASTLDEDVHADYMSAAISRRDQTNTQTDSSTADAALNGGNGSGGAAPAAVVTTGPDLGDQVVALLDRGKPAPAAAVSA
jgi:ATP-dependent Clp protease protease subunit